MTARLLDYAAPVLRAARTEANLSQAEIAERAGVSDATISRMEIDPYATATGLTQHDGLERNFIPWREDARGGLTH